MADSTPSPRMALKRYAAARRLKPAVCSRINIHYGDEPQTSSVTLTREGREFRVMAGSSMIEIEVGFPPSALTTLHLNVNRPHYFCHDPVVFKTNLGRHRLRVFKDRKESARDRNAWLGSKAHVEALDALGLAPQESLFVMPGGLSCNLLPGKDIGDAIDGLLRLMRLLPRETSPRPKGSFVVEGLRLDPTQLPARLRPLVPLIRRWAIGDDKRRARTRNQIKSKVVPLLGSINRYLDAYPHRDEAVLLTRLAAAALELSSD